MPVSSASYVNLPAQRLALFAPRTLLHSLSERLVEHVYRLFVARRREVLAVRADYVDGDLPFSHGKALELGGIVAVANQSHTLGAPICDCSYMTCWDVTSLIVLLTCASSVSLRLGAIVLGGAGANVCGNGEDFRSVSQALRRTAGVL